MSDKEVFCEDLDRQLEVFESQIQGIRDKKSGATEDGRAKMSDILDRWPEATLLARRRTDELRQSTEDWIPQKDSTVAMWAELKSMVDQASAAY